MLRRHRPIPHALTALALALGFSLAQARQVSIHDPVLAKEGDSFYLFSTGPGITIYRSTDLRNWRLQGRAFVDEPAWARRVAPGFNGHLWAPDISYHDGKYFLYYSVSAFGKNTSAIGVTVSRTLDPSSPDYRWEDRGVVLQSIPGRDAWNAIDPNVIVDETGVPWLSFGSFWSGLKLVRLAPDRVSLAEPQEWHTIARRDRAALEPDTEPGTAALEAPFIFRKGEFYYLFVSWDKCCRGKDSTYKLMVGRSRSVRGPYLDRDGRDLADGGGSLVLGGTPAWPGLGHNGAYTFDGKDFLVFHAYEAADNGLQKLKIAELHWDADAWPVVDPAVLEQFHSLQLE
ncbi:MAG: arabinan endo-1,5-alpha-L-arabinosidase [Opitutaceae bacterium]